MRYLFLSRLGYRWLVGAAVLWAVTVLVGLLLVPIGLQSLLLEPELEVERGQRRLQRDILAQRERALDRLLVGLGAARLRQRQVALVLGAGPDGGVRRPAAAGRPLAVSVPEAQLALYRGLRLERESEALLERTDRLAQLADEQRELTRLVPSVCPLPPSSYVLTSTFGERVSPYTGSVDFHAGVDLAAHEGTAVVATGAARVVLAGAVPGRGAQGWWRYGTVAVLDHGGRFVTVYAHLARVDVRRGAEVRRGQQIGTVGSTGWSTSPHLHYEVRVARPGAPDPVPVDPRLYILDGEWLEDAPSFLEARAEAPPGRFEPLPFR